MVGYQESDMAVAWNVPRHVGRHADEGYRTPMIEDRKSSVSIERGGACSFLFQSAQEADPSVLGALNGSGIRLILSTNTQYGKGEIPDSITGIYHGVSPKVEGEASEELGWKQRIRHFTWAYFTLTMATGGIANVLYNIPGRYQFQGIKSIGIIVFLLNIVLYVIIWTLLILRFYFFPSMFKASFLHPTESLFVPATIVSFGTILINISQYGLGKTGEWLVEVVYVLFWFNAAFAVICSAGIYLLLWSTQTFTIAQLTPIWIFPAYPMLIIGPHAAVLSAYLAASRCFRIIIGGFTIQSVGFLVSLMVYSAYIYRLMTQKLPKENIRPGMFVSVGPSAFTVAAVVNMAADAQRSFPPDFMGDGKLAGNVVRVTDSFACLWLWGLAIFFFFVATFAHLSTIGHGRIIFSMAWFSFIFLNTALITATFAIGSAFSCEPIEIIGLAMTVALILMYFFVLYMMIRAIVLHHILWPQKGEDKDEGGFKIKEIKPDSLGGRPPVRV